MGRHFLNLDQARTLPTTALQMIEQAVSDVVTTRAMGAVHGPAGLGKTFAVEQALTRVRDVVVSWTIFPSRPTMRLVTATLLQQLTGGPTGRASRFVLLDQLVEELAIRPRLLVIDFTDRLYACS